MKTKAEQQRAAYERAKEKRIRYERLLDHAKAFEAVAKGNMQHAQKLATRKEWV